MSRSLRRIARLLAYRERLERQAERSLAEARRAVLEREERLEAVRAARRRLTEQGGAPRRGAVELELLLSGQAHGRQLLRHADAQAAALRHAREEERARLVALLERRRERRALELLVERRRAALRREERRRAAERLDEAGALRWWRGQASEREGW